MSRARVQPWANRSPVDTPVVDSRLQVTTYYLLLTTYYLPEAATMTILDEIGASIRQLAQGAGASVVGIGQRWGAGSGIGLGEGQVLTNAHNVRGDRVTVTFTGGRTAEGSVAGHDI